MTEGDPDEEIWANWSGPMGDGNDSIENLESILEEALEAEAEDARLQLQNEIADARQIFGLE